MISGSDFGFGWLKILRKGTNFQGASGGYWLLFLYPKDQVPQASGNEPCCATFFFWGILSSSDERQELFDNFIKFACSFLLFLKKFSK